MTLSPHICGKAMAEAEVKVAFVSNLNGTTVAEVSLGSFLAPLCLLSRGLFLIVFHLCRGILPLAKGAHLLLDFTMLIMPLVLSCTVLSGILHWVIIGLAVADLFVLFLLYRNKKTSSHGSILSSLDSFVHSHVESNLVPFVTAFRVLVNVKTAISILAVDFSVFPRRYAKTETYGTGVMDFGVGAYVMANALVCPEARGKKIQGSKFSHLVKQLLSVWPLILLGLVRLASVKSMGYHEHVTEYGVHWNFFFTLAIVRVVASALLIIFPINSSWLVALLISGVYQVVLETTDLKSFITQNGERNNFVEANREGIFSVVGYIAIYMAGVQAGLYLMRTRTLVQDWIRVLMILPVIAALLPCASPPGPPSRASGISVTDSGGRRSNISATSPPGIFQSKGYENFLSSRSARCRTCLFSYKTATFEKGCPVRRESYGATSWEKDMARLVAVCRDGEEDYLFLARQIPLYIDDTLTMVMEFPDSVLDFDSHQINSSQMKQFIEHHSMLKQQDLNMALMVMSREVFSALSQLVPCVGCRRSVERLFSQLTDSGYFALEPLTVGSAGVLSVTRACLADPRKLYTLFYVHGSKLNDIIDAIPKSKKNKRCQLHSLDTHKPKPLGCCREEGEAKGLALKKKSAAAAGSKEVRCSVLFHFGPFQTPYRGSWMDIWELMSQECRDEVVLIDSACLLETLETYLRKHRFCTDCKNKVLRAYNILVGELDCSKEKGYCAALYEGLRCCPHERHIHVCCETDFIAHLLGRAEPEFAGGYERRERHAKTIDIAQEEVLTCLGIHLYERLHRIWQKLRAEEQTWQILFYLGIDALRKSFEMAVEKVQGISRLEQLCEELSEEERAKELKQEKKRQKRKNRRKNKCGFDMSEQEAEGDKEKSLDEGSTESVDSSCKSCGSGEESGGSVEVMVPIENSSCSCPATSILGSPKPKKGLSSHSNGSDCGYSSSIEGSETGSREGSDVACTEGMCNHDETGEFSCSHHCSEDKEEDGVDSCVECWANSEEHTKGKNKKKKRKSKGSMCGNEPGSMSESSRRGLSGLESPHDPTTSSTHSCRSQETCPKLCCGSFTSITSQLSWADQQRKGGGGLVLGQPPPTDTSAQGDCTTKSLMELLDEAEASLDEENCLTQDEIQSFVEENKSFYSTRDQYRQHLKDRFTKYCHSSVCSEWLPTTSVN
ncbi:hypothetical protein AOLI_G00265200 [Acnodon oligacanthus]